MARTLQHCDGFFRAKVANHLGAGQDGDDFRNLQRWKKNFAKISDFGAETINRNENYGKI